VSDRHPYGNLNIQRKNPLKNTIALAFTLLLVLMLLVYYQGLQADAGAVGSTVTNWGYMLTGRNGQGGFSSYPATAK
jgi:hypothetical protein